MKHKREVEEAVKLGRNVNSEDRAKRRVDVIYPNIEKERLRLGMSEREFATNLGIRLQIYRNWLNGAKPIPSDILIKLSQMCNVKADFLLEVADERSRK